MTDPFEYVILAAIAIETCVWLFVLHRTGQIQRAIAPIVARLLPFVSTLPVPSVPPGAMGLPQSAALAPAASTATPEVLLTKKGQPYYKDPVTGMARFLPKGTKVAPTPTVALSGGGTDLNALARSFGYEPDQIAAMVQDNIGSIPQGPGGPSNGGPPSVPTGGSNVTDAVLASMAQKFMAGELSQADIMPHLPLVIKWLRANWKAGSTAGGAAVDSRDRW